MSDTNPPQGPGSGQEWSSAPPPQQQGGPWAPPPGQYPGGGYAPSGPVSSFGAPLAEWWKRLVAIIIDGLILAIPTYLIIFVVFAGTFTAGQATIDPVTGEITGGSPGMFSGAFIGVGLVAMIIPLIYYAVMNGSERGQTVGKMAMSIRVRDANTGGPIGVGKGFVRALIPTIGGAICGLISLIDGLAPLWDAKRQAWHDKMANSVVVDA
jgi:uncharacterized RDD family membrane protein YckC